jgi:hypothetical protein
MLGGEVGSGDGMGLGGNIVSSSFERVLVDVRLSGRKKCGLVFFYFFNGADVD